MSKTFDFLRECGTFFLLTSSKGCPQGRPFGAIAEIDGNLCFSTSRVKKVYAQIRENPFIQITAIKPNSRSWIRISGFAFEQTSPEIRIRMMEAYPTLQMRFLGVNDENFVVFSVEDAEVEFHEESVTSII